MALDPHIVVKPSNGSTGQALVALDLFPVLCILILYLVLSLLEIIVVRQIPTVNNWPKPSHKRGPKISTVCDIFSKSTVLSTAVRLEVEQETAAAAAPGALCPRRTPHTARRTPLHWRAGAEVGRTPQSFAQQHSLQSFRWTDERPKGASRAAPRHLPLPREGVRPEARAPVAAAAAAVQ